jgi:transposase
MSQDATHKHIPVNLTKEEFNTFVLPHLSEGARGPKPKLPLWRTFNYILHLLYTGCQWKMIPIDKDEEGKIEIHHTTINRKFMTWCNDGSLKKAFICSVLTLDKLDMLDLTVLHGDGSDTAAKKGGDLIGFNGHKRMKGIKVMAIVDRNVNIICPFIFATGNASETKLFPQALSSLKEVLSKLGKSTVGKVFSLDSGYDSRKNRKLCFNSGMVPNIKEIQRKRKTKKPGPKRIYDEGIFRERFRTVERAFAWEDKFKRLLLRFEFKSEYHIGLKLLAYTMINLRHFCHA